MQNVLFVESGVHEGGSFMSLVKHIEALDKTKTKPVIVFFNDNKWIKIFKEKGYDVYLIQDVVFSKNNSKIHLILNSFFMKGFIKWKVISFLKWLHKSSIKEIESIIVKHDISYVHLNTELFRDRIGLIAAVNSGVPVVSHLRSKYELGKIHFSKQYIAFANQNISKYIAVSEDTASFWVKHVKVDEQKIQVLYDYFEPIASKDIFNSNIYDYDGIKIVCVANLVPVKGHQFLLESCAPVLKELNAKLFLVGRGEDEYIQSLKTVAKKLDIVDKIQLIGYTDKVDDYLLQSDVVLLFSIREGLPNIIIEGLGAGAIIIATNVGGIPEIIDDKKNGFLVTYGDSNAASQIIRDVLMLKKESRKVVVDNAGETIHNKFSKKNYSEIISKIYE
tara:strand:- start:283 stop:1452 length:1170 start_codon:yes stop_codon:yes gene_type:complete